MSFCSEYKQKKRKGGGDTHQAMQFSQVSLPGALGGLGPLLELRGAGPGMGDELLVAAEASRPRPHGLMERVYCLSLLEAEFQSGSRG